MKQFEIYLLIGIVILLVMPTSLAAEFDNIKKVPKDFRIKEDKIRIENLFGIGRTIADIKLIENTDQALVNGEAKFYVELYKDYRNPINEVKFKGRNNEDQTRAYQRIG